MILIIYMQEIKIILVFLIEIPSLLLINYFYFIQNKIPEFHTSHNGMHKDRCIFLFALLLPNLHNRIIYPN